MLHFILIVGRVIKSYLHLHGSMMWRNTFDTVIKDVFKKSIGYTTKTTEKNMEPYYFTQLDKLQKSAYVAIKTGLKELAPSFPVPRLENKELGDIFFKLRLDCPEIFYAVGFKYRFYQESDHMEMIPEYLFNKAKIKEFSTAMHGTLSG